MRIRKFAAEIGTGLLAVVLIYSGCFMAEGCVGEPAPQPASQHASQPAPQAEVQALVEPATPPTPPTPAAKREPVVAVQPVPSGDELVQKVEQMLDFLKKQRREELPPAEVEYEDGVPSFTLVEEIQEKDSPELRKIKEELNAARAKEKELSHLLLRQKVKDSSEALKAGKVDVDPNIQDLPIPSPFREAGLKEGDIVTFNFELLIPPRRMDASGKKVIGLKGVRIPMTCTLVVQKFWMHGHWESAGEMGSFDAPMNTGGPSSRLDFWELGGFIPFELIDFMTVDGRFEVKEDGTFSFIAAE